jgi:hypothetical protein
MTTTFHDLLFGPVLEDRPCGDCVACCVLLNIDEPELVKPEGAVCPNCTGQGCAVYDTRPQVCRGWNCAWKRIESLPSRTRPDVLGLMFTIERHLPPRNVFEHLYIVGCALTGPADFESADAREMIRMFSEGPLPVFVSWDGMKTLVHPEPLLADAIMNPAAHRDGARVAEGRRWLERYAPFAHAGAGEQAKLPEGL